MNYNIKKELQKKASNKIRSRSRKSLVRRRSSEICSENSAADSIVLFNTKFYSSQNV